MTPMGGCQQERPRKAAYSISNGIERKSNIHVGHTSNVAVEGFADVDERVGWREVMTETSRGRRELEV